MPAAKATKPKKPKKDKAPPKFPVQHRIREIRESKGLSMAQVAEKIGTTQASVSRIETGQRELTEGWMRSIAKALEVDPIDLIEMAAFVDLRDEVAATELAVPGPISGLLNSREIEFLHLVASNVSLAGYERGADVAFVCSGDVPTRVKTGDIVLVRVRRRSDGTTVRIVRQFIAPSSLATNRAGRNVIINLDEPRFEIEILGIAEPRG